MLVSYDVLLERGLNDDVRLVKRIDGTPVVNIERHETDTDFFDREGIIPVDIAYNNNGRGNSLEL